MKNIITIIGARPQIIKAAALSRAVREKYFDEIDEILIHTGQHYDENMSEVFFKEMNIPRPAFNLGVGSKSHGQQTAEMISKTEELLTIKNPDFVILYGDTNSTLAGSVAASKLHVPIIHIEAGLRSFNKSMPEEINRIVCDHTSTLLFTPTRTGLNNLIREGFNPSAKPPFSADNPGVFHCGDIMYDNSLYFGSLAEKKSDILKKLDLEPGSFILGTIHRDLNTDDPYRLNSIFESLIEITKEMQIKVVLPLHPRTSKLLEKNLNPDTFKAINNNSKLMILPPVSFLDITVLEKNCKMVLTDSGGVQKEAYFFKKPVIVLRQETEWQEIIENGAGRITDISKENIMNAVQYYSLNNNLRYPPVFGDGQAAEFICSQIVKA